MTLPPETPPTDELFNQSDSSDNSLNQVKINNDGEPIVQMPSRTPSAKRWYERSYIPRKHLVLCAYFLISSTNAFHWVQYTVLNDLIISKLQMSEQLVGFTSIVYMAVYCIAAIPAANLLERKGLRISLLLASGLTLLGSLVKVMSSEFGTVNSILIGQTLAAFGQAFFLGAPPNVAALWYPPEHQNKATAVAVFANAIGTATGFIIPPLFVTADNFELNLHVLHCQLAVACAIAFLATLLFVKHNPKSTEESEEDEDTGEQMITTHQLCVSSSSLVSNKTLLPPGSSLFDIYKKLFTHLQFMILFVVYGLNVGLSSAVLTILPRLLSRPSITDLDETSKEAGQLGLVYVFSGILGILIVAALLDRSHRYLQTSLLLNIVALIGFIEFTIVCLNEWDYRILFPITAQIGYTWSAFIMIGYEFGAEITFPLPETISGALLTISTQAFGVVITELAELILDNFGTKTCFYSLIGLMIFMIAINLLITDDLPRQKAFELARQRSPSVSYQPHAKRTNAVSNTISDDNRAHS